MGNYETVDELMLNEIYDFSFFQDGDGELVDIMPSFNQFIDSLNDLSFYEKTYLLMNRTHRTHQDMADYLGTTKQTLTKVRKNPLCARSLSEELINLCEEIGLPCQKERWILSHHK